jgi:hypothetical protein
MTVLFCIMLFRCVNEILLHVMVVNGNSNLYILLCELSVFNPG